MTGVVVRTGGPQDVRFMRDMLRHAYHGRMSSPDLPVSRYVDRWGRRGDAALVALEGPTPVGVAWYRLFTADEPGFGFVDEETPELTIAVVPSRRGHGVGSKLLEALLARARTAGFRAVSLSVRRDEPSVPLYERHGFVTVREADDVLAMRAEL